MVNNLLHIFHQSLKRRLTDEELYEINGLLVRYPYFSLLHQLKAKYAPTRENIFVASTYATSRELLQNYLGGTLYFTKKEMISEMQAPSHDEIPVSTHPANDTFSIVDFRDSSSPEKSLDDFSVFVSRRSEDIHEFLNTEIRIRTAKYYDLIRRVRAELRTGIRVLKAPESVAEEISQREVIHAEEVPVIDEVKAQSESPKIEPDREANRLVYKKDGRVVEISVTSEQYEALFANPPEVIEKELPKKSTPPKKESAPPPDSRLKKSRRFEAANTPPDENIQKSIQPDDEMISETLAELHVQQGNNKDAIEIYHKLSLLFPEKSSYFVARIKKLKEE